jgi:DNA invertase Pin-like site-specific DNA recombinase
LSISEPFWTKTIDDSYNIYYNDNSLKNEGGGGKMKKAVLYIRVSTVEQAQGGVSLADQEEKLLQYCKLQNIEAVKVIREEGISASKHIKDRPGGAELLQLLKEGKADNVIALKLDRLFRDAEDALRESRAWDKADIALHLVDMGGQTINTASAMGRFFLSMMSSFAELERNLISERTEAALQYKKAHREAYSPVPYGFIREGDSLQEDEAEQQTVKNILAWRAKGWTLRKIAAELTAQGRATKQGGQWRANTVSYILNNSLYRKVA